MGSFGPDIGNNLKFALSGGTAGVVPSASPGTLHSSETRWATKTKVGTVTGGKKVLLIHHGKSTARIAFTEKTSGDAIEKTIRRECGLSPNDQFSLLDRDSDSVVIDGSMLEGELWLDSSGNSADLKIEPKPKPQQAATMLPSRTPPNFDTLPEENAIKHTFDLETGKWSQTPCQVKLDNKPFGKGSLRKAFYMQDMSDQSTIYVAKCSIDPFEEKSTYFQDVELQMYAKKMAKQFNMYNPPKKIDFVVTWIITLVDRSDKPLMAVEKFIDGPYRKHNNNFGYVNETERNTPQAFSHFTYEATNHRALVCDIQGVNDLYTDPQIHTEESIPAPGKGNLGSSGIEKFLSTHRCNAICRYLKLPSVNAKEVDIGTLPAQPVMKSGQVDFVHIQFVANENNGLLRPSTDDQNQENQRLLQQEWRQKSRRSCCFCSLI